eukprot:Pgem_evm1s8521
MAIQKQYSQPQTQMESLWNEFINVKENNNNSNSSITSSHSISHTSMNGDELSNYHNENIPFHRTFESPLNFSLNMVENFNNSYNYNNNYQSLTAPSSPFNNNVYPCSPNSPAVQSTSSIGRADSNVSTFSLPNTPLHSLRQQTYVNQYNLDDQENFASYTSLEDMLSSPIGTEKMEDMTLDNADSMLSLSNYKLHSSFLTDIDYNEQHEPQSQQTYPTPHGTP